jgi:ATP-dependent Clp protease ATP-binding subunit ClpC
MKNADRFTERARLAITKAQEAAAELGHSYVGTEHLLLGIARESDGLGAKVLRENGFDDSLLSELVEKLVGRGAAGAPIQGLTPRAKRVIELAMGDANRLGHNYVGTEHLLMGVLREPESAAARLITSAGADLNKLYTEIMDLFAAPDYRPVPRQTAVRAPVRRTETKTLDQYSRDLTELAAKGELDPVVGRDEEIRRAGRGQDRHRGRTGPARGGRRRAGKPERKARRLPGPHGHAGRHEVPGRL